MAVLFTFSNNDASTAALVQRELLVSKDDELEDMF